MKIKFFCPLCKVRVYSMRRDPNGGSRVNCPEHGGMKLYPDGSHVLVKPVPSRAIRKQYAPRKGTPIRGETLLEMAEEIHNRLGESSVPLVVWLNEGSLSVTRSSSTWTLGRIPERDVIGIYDAGVSWNDLSSDLGHFHDRLAADVSRPSDGGSIDNQDRIQGRNGPGDSAEMCQGSIGQRAEVFDWTEIVKAA